MMKRISLIITSLLLAWGFVSCDMDKYPSDGIAQIITSVSDAENIRVGLYSRLKHHGSGSFYVISDYQSDLFHVSATYGNYFGDWVSWNIGTTNLELQDMFYWWYNTIANCNYLIEGIESLMATEDLTTDEIKDLETYFGEAHWVRAFCYYNLALDWCDAYDSSTANQTLGMMLQTVYAPSSVSSTYPPRSSLYDTFALIVDDLDIAEQYLTSTGSSNSYYLNADVVAAFQARVALYMGEWSTAISKATSVINSGRYPLINNQNDFDYLWEYDSGSENIFVAQIQSYNDFETAISSDVSTQTGYYFLFNANGAYATYNPQFIPEQWVIDLFASTPDDIRLNSYFEDVTIEWPSMGNYDLYVIVKYPGNPELNAGSGSTYYYTNKAKILRSAEMYLIAAEAYYHNNNESSANDMLNQLRTERIPSWINTPYTPYSGTALRDQIRNERVRELYAEGTRLSDLKRWGLGMSRGTPQDPDAVFSLHNSLSIPAGDNRFLWPIPQREIDNNPQVEQNPQY